MNKAVSFLASLAGLAGAVIAVIQWSHRHHSSVHWLLGVPIYLCSAITLGYVGIALWNNRGDPDGRLNVAMLGILTLGSWGIIYRYGTLLTRDDINAVAATVYFLLMLTFAAYIAYGWLDGRSKKCPECAEKVKAEAKVCRYCHYRFSSED